MKLSDRILNKVLEPFNDKQIERLATITIIVGTMILAAVFTYSFVWGMLFVMSRIF